ncbi:MAG: hypothetical protein ACK4HE_07555 [Chitinophagaceae bacterium]
MNYKFLGNALDLFKYDLIIQLCNELNISLFYIPMLTKPEPKKRDPKYALYEIGSKNQKLYEFLRSANEDNSACQITDIIEYLKDEVLTVQWITQDYNLSDAGLYVHGCGSLFTGERSDRTKYFNQVYDILGQTQGEKLIFLDPDVGIDTGQTQRYRKAPRLYFTLPELQAILKQRKEGDIVCFFQHLGNPYKSLEQKIEELNLTSGIKFAAIRYKRISMAMVFAGESSISMAATTLRTYATMYNADILTS